MASLARHRRALFALLISSCLHGTVMYALSPRDKYATSPRGGIFLNAVITEKPAEASSDLATRSPQKEKSPPTENLTARHSDPSNPPAKGPAIEPKDARSPAFFPMEQLNQKPHLITPPMLDTLGNACAGISDAFRLTLWIDSEGKVADTRIDNETAPASCAEAVTKAFNSALFSPGKIGNEAVGSLMPIEIKFDDTPDLPPDNH